jgi:tetratricopeptide (TPR) repeat protein
MLKKIIFIFLLYLFSFQNLIAAGSSGSNDSKKMTDYDWAERKILKAKKLEKKDKIEKAKKNYEAALKNLEKAYKNNPTNPDILNYLGFVTRKLGNYKDAEIFYLIGLEIEPNHVGINEYLGELYVTTDRINLAKERLDILKNCNCDEYTELKAIIDGKKKSKY